MAVEILHIDCLEKLQIMAAGSVDLFVQDTPFGVTQNEWDMIPDLEKMWPEWLRVGKKDCAYIFFATQPFASDLINSNRKMFRYDIIWYKPLCTGFLNAKRMPLRNHETILVFYKNLPTFNPEMGVGEIKKGLRTAASKSTNYNDFASGMRYDNKGARFPQSVIEFSNVDRTTESDHPTQKPIDLIRYLIRTYSNAGELVFDGYGGSGTSACAAEMEGRNAIVCETNKKYYDKSLIRLNQQTMQQDLFKQAI